MADLLCNDTGRYLYLHIGHDFDLGPGTGEDGVAGYTGSAAYEGIEVLPKLGI